MKFLKENIVFILYLFSYFNNIR